MRLRFFTSVLCFQLLNDSDVGQGTASVYELNACVCSCCQTLKHDPSCPDAISTNTLCLTDVFREDKTLTKRVVLVCSLAAASTRSLMTETCKIGRPAASSADSGITCAREADTCVHLLPAITTSILRPSTQQYHSCTLSLSHSAVAGPQLHGRRWD